MRAGASAEALRELLWCFDEGMPHVPAYSGVRRSFLLSRIQELSATYAPAWQALQARYQATIEKLQSGDFSSNTVRDFAALERAVGIERKGLGAPEANWQAAEEVHTEGNISVIAPPVATIIFGPTP